MNSNQQFPGSGYSLPQNTEENFPNLESTENDENMKNY